MFFAKGLLILPDKGLLILPDTGPYEYLQGLYFGISIGFEEIMLLSYLKREPHGDTPHTPNS